MKSIFTLVNLILLLGVAIEAAPNWHQLTWPSASSYRSRNARDERIIGGGTATFHQFPYQVGMFLDGTGFCGGSLISETVVLTAAHCATGTSTFEVHLGAQSINNDNEADRVIFFTRDAVIHSLWSLSTLSNDIAIVRLPVPASGPGIEVIRLPAYSQASETFEGQMGRLTGWGHISDQSVGINPQLKYVNLTVIRNDQCELFFAGVIDTSKLCTDSVGGTAGPCIGDFGGPLVITEADGMLTQIAIASFISSAGCEAGAPAGYTRLTSFLGWLEFNAGVTIRP